MLIAGVDNQGCHLFQTCPSGNLYDHVAAAIGKTNSIFSPLSHFQCLASSNGAFSVLLCPCIQIALAAGARSQASKTYLEKNVGKLEALSLDEASENVCRIISLCLIVLFAFRSW